MGGSKRLELGRVRRIAAAASALALLVGGLVVSWPNGNDVQPAPEIEVPAVTVPLPTSHWLDGAH